MPGRGPVFLGAAAPRWFRPIYHVTTSRPPPTVVQTVPSGQSAKSARQAAPALSGRLADNAREQTQMFLAAANAALPDIVQLGGIYTPPAYRGRGYARASVAGSLMSARKRGVTRAVLFTSNPSAARSYEGVGFRRLGDYGLVLLE